MTSTVPSETLPEPSGRATSSPAVPATGVGARLHGLLATIPTMVLWALVVLWTVPTAGMLMSSFRPGIAVRTNGWWTELPDPLPDRFGRSVLAAVLIAAVGTALGYALTSRSSRARRAVAVAATALLVAAIVVAYPDVIPAVPGGLGILAAAGAVVALVRVLDWGVTRLNGSGRAILAAVVAAVSVLALAVSAELALGVAVVLAAWLLGYSGDCLSRPARAVSALATVALVALIVVVSATELTLENYREVFSTTGSDAPNMWQHFLNSVAITLPATIIPIAIAAFAGYAFAWMDFRGRHWLFISVVALLAVPFQMSLVPLVQLYNSGAHLTVFGETITLIPDPNLAASQTSVWLTHIGFGLPLAVFLLHNYIASLPRDIFEAARIDGADHPTIFWRLVLPLSVPALAAFAIFQFLWVWNDYLVARTFLGSGGAGFDNAPMTIRLATLSGSRGQDWHLLTSAAFVSIAVPLLIFFLLQRYFVRGLLAGSVKG